jgi:pimeloyl-ACP methyl ester carboxylesterase
MPRIVAEDWFVQASAPRTRIHLRRKTAAPDAQARAPRSVIVFVHGATYSGPSAYDAPLPGGSWLDYAAAHGHDAYALSVRGYGQSSRPQSLPFALLPEPPYARTADAIADLEAAVEEIRARTGAERVDLVGWSWGSSICGGYAARHPERVGRLVLYAPLWILRELPVPGLIPAWLPMVWLRQFGPMYSAWLGAFRHVSLDDIRRRWFGGLDQDTAAALCPPEQMEQWWRHTVQADAGPGDAPTARLRVPNGVLADLIEHWAAGLPTYDPGRITAPVLVVLGEWDRETPPAMARELFDRLSASPDKHLEILPQGTHAMSLEVNRFHLYERVQRFLEATQPGPAGQAGA